ncbi:MAG: hypothetical protein EOO60_04825, partial [Hymenobacter sp.]
MIIDNRFLLDKQPITTDFSDNLLLLMLPNLLFDFGGVIIDIDYNRPPAAFRRLSRAGSTVEY